MVRSLQGFTLLELLVVIVIISILGAVGFTNLPRDSFAANQAAEGLARDVQYARFQAISRNTFVGVRLLPNSTSYQIYRTDRAGAFDADNVIKEVALASSRTPRAKIATVTPEAGILVFDPRGISYLDAAKEVRILAGSGYERVVAISRQGRVTIE